MLPLVLIPGTLCDASVFGPLIEQLGMPECSGEAISHPTVETAADAIAARAPDRFVALGFSLGGFVVLDLMRRHPRRLAGAVLIASNAFPFRDSPDAKRQELAMFERGGGKAIVARHWASYVAPANAARADLHCLVQDMAAQTPYANFAAQTELAISRPDSRALLAATGVPTLIIDGSEDRMSPPQRNRTLQTSSAVCRIEIAGCGHFVPLEAPAEAARAIAAFIKEPALCGPASSQTASPGPPTVPAR